MTNVLLQLEEFVRRANGARPEDRVGLLNEITDIFLLDPASLSLPQANGFGAIMQHLAYQQDVDVRGELAYRLAEQASAPRALMRRLAGDEILVAEPVLRHSPVLTDGDLIAIADTHSQLHLRAITQRAAVSTALADKLVERGDDETVEILLLNENADLREETAWEIAERAMRATALQSALIERKGVSSDILTSAYFYVEGDLKERILKAWADIRVRDLTPDQSSPTFKLANAMVNSVERRIEALQRKGALNEAQVLRFARKQMPMEFIFALAKLARIDVETARKVVDDQTGKSLIVVCKATKMSPVTFKGIAMSPLTKIAARPEDMLPLLSLYNRFSFADADRVISFWRSQKGVIGPKSRLDLEQMAAESA